jgi:O-antigen ligase
MKLSELELTKFRASQVTLFLAPFTTLIVNPWTSYDPISLPKMLVLTSGAFYLLAIMLVTKNDSIPSLAGPALWISGFFMFFMLIAFLLSGSPLNQQLWGSFGRNTGLLTYFSLIILLLALVWMRNSQFYLRLAWFLVLTSIPMTFYCLVQIAGKDPIPWSEFNTFGTLGNINFLSAFLGMTSIGAIIFALDKGFTLTRRGLLFLLAATDLIIIYSTGSIQGPIIFIIGIGVLTFLNMLNLKKFRVIAIGVFSISSLSIGYLAAIALRNVGPLASIIYQPSVTFRGDYIHAGWEMTFLKPFFGVGMDSYGDWYRSARGEISTLRTGPDRVANSAHNIFLDISSNGGVMLGLTYLCLILFVLYSSVRVLKSDLRNSTEFKVIFSVWVAYQVQALVSINQIGVGVWGWALSGALIGICYLSKEIPSITTGKIFRAKSKELRGRTMKASHALAGIGGLTLGVLLSAIPLNADIRYRAASDRGDLAEMVKAVNALGSTEFHHELVLDFAMRNNRSSEIKEIATNLVAIYPRSFFGWRVLSVAAFSSPEERAAALQKARELDPFNPDLR